MKGRIPLLLLFFGLAMLGCQTNSTEILQDIVVEDQTFTLSANSVEGIKVGQVTVSGPDNFNPRFQLIANEYSNFFTINESTGEFFAHGIKALSSKLKNQIELEILVSYSEATISYGKIANLKINFTDLPENLSVTLEATTSVAVNSGYPATTLGNSELINVNSWTVGLTPMTQRAYLRFNLDTLPSEVVIERVMLKLFNPKDGNIDNTHLCHGCTNPFYIRRVLTNWKSETLTWSTQPGYSIGDQTLAPSSSSGDQDYSIDVTETVRAMISDREANNGIVLMLADEEPYRRLCFCSSNHPNLNLRPKLEITYLY